MATTRIISMHINKGKTIAQCLKARVDYIENPEKTNGGELISSYACSPETADQEFLLARNEYMAITGRRIHNEVIAYHPISCANPSSREKSRQRKQIESAMNWRPDF